ncbi:hypothetical protein ONZ45_g17953 [Pleurotus djamor]|nr:hypothetical protein ONZ45_g17953 [Pleurotus djamor]
MKRHTTQLDLAPSGVEDKDVDQPCVWEDGFLGDIGVVPSTARVVASLLNKSPRRFGDALEGTKFEREFIERVGSGNVQGPQQFVLHSPSPPILLLLDLSFSSPPTSYTPTHLPSLYSPPLTLSPPSSPPPPPCFASIPPLNPFQEQLYGLDFYYPHLPRRRPQVSSQRRPMSVSSPTMTSPTLAMRTFHLLGLRSVGQRSRHRLRREPLSSYCPQAVASHPSAAAVAAVAAT